VLQVGTAVAATAAAATDRVQQILPASDAAEAGAVGCLLGVCGVVEFTCTVWGCCLLAQTYHDMFDLQGGCAA
jgi:hypothetical protein